MGVAPNEGKPDVEVVTAEVGAPSPDATFPKPVKPDAGVVTPEAGALKLDADRVKPDATVVVALLPPNLKPLIVDESFVGSEAVDC